MNLIYYKLYKIFFLSKDDEKFLFNIKKTLLNCLFFFKNLVIFFINYGEIDCLDYHFTVPATEYLDECFKYNMEIFFHSLTTQFYHVINLKFNEIFYYFLFFKNFFF